jgi:diacylglycerol kinase (ATP)
MNRVSVIINPISAGGRTASRMFWLSEQLYRRLGGRLEWHVTTAQGDATQLAQRATEEGLELVIAVGGDGTVQEVVNGLIVNDRVLNPHTALAIIGSGTGNGLAQSLGLPWAWSAQIELALNGSERRLDVGKVSWMNKVHEQQNRYFVNECQVGIGAAVSYEVEHGRKRFGGKFGYGRAALSHLLHYRSSSVRVSTNSHDLLEEELVGVIAANGSRTGGGMRLAPAATLDDGLLDLVLISEMPFLERLRAFSKIYSGGHIGLPGIRHMKVRHLEIEAEVNVLLEADGEVIGSLPCRIDVLPGLLRVKAPQPAE